MSLYAKRLERGRAIASLEPEAPGAAPYPSRAAVERS